MVNNDIIINELETKAEFILELKRRTRPKRPLVIEFCGSPKSGKTTSMNALNIFLKRNGFRTMVLTEKASICPVPNKEDYLFNVWTISSTIAELVEKITLNPCEIDVIMCDRGIFDSICWFQWMLNRKHMDKESYESLIKYLTMDKWKTVIDLIFMFSCSPGKSIEREHKDLLTKKPGSIMNEIVLSDYVSAMLATRQKYSNSFRCIRDIDTSNLDFSQTNYKVTLSTLDGILEVIEEKIACVNKKEISDITKINGMKPFSNSGFLVNVKIEYIRRDTAEGSNDYFQLIPIAVIMTESRVLAVRKTKNSIGSKDSSESDRQLLYVGGHVRSEDELTDNTNIDTVKTALIREVNEEIGLNISLDDNEPIAIYDNSNEKSARHIAICFKFITKDIRPEKLSLDNYEFSRIGNNQSKKSIELLSFNEPKVERMEAWSKFIYYNILSNSQQGVLFEEKDMK